MDNVPRRYILWTLLFLLLLGGGGFFVVNLWKENQANKQKQAILVEQLRQATEAQKEATVTRRISTQLEEIAYQQKEISDQQKQEAVNQTRIADQMREHAELEREKALAAQQAALDAYDQMEEQKKLAESRREEAVKAQMKADTLARLALGRSLGSQASAQYTAGNKDLAFLLSYSAWKFTSENQGDVYQPAIFDALSQTSELSQHWRLHKAAICDIQYFRNGQGEFLVSASKYGELFLWKISRNDLIRQRVLVNHPDYDFRNVRVNPAANTFIALSYNSKLVCIDREGTLSEIQLPIEEPIGLERMSDQLYIASKKGDLLKMDPDRSTFTPVYKHQHPITAFTGTQGGLMLGDNQGGIYLVDEQGKATLQGKTIQQPVTYIQSDPKTEILAIGYKNGLVVVSNPKNGTSQELVGHISAITEIRFMNGKLFTSSYDGSIRLWNMDNENKIGSSIVYQSSAWIHTFVSTPNGEQIFTGDEQGNLSSVSISPEHMATEIKKHLTRNFTQEEWDYYIGELSKYETYK